MALISSSMFIVATIATATSADDNIAVAIRAMKQVAVWWESSGIDEFGKPSYAAPVEIECRWDDAVEEFVGSNGDREISRSKLIVDRDLKVKDKLKLGALSIAIEGNPDDNEDAWEIRLFKKTPDFKGRKYLREVYL